MADWWTDNDPGSGVDQTMADQVAGFYQQYLGRAPENADVVNSWVTGLGQSGGIGAVQQAIANSPEAQAFARNPVSNSNPGGGQGPQYTDPQQMMTALLGQGTDPNSAIQQVNAKFNLPSGSSYAWRSIPGAPGGGVVEVPGGQYFAPGPDGKWGLNPGDSGGGGNLGGTGVPTPPPYQATPTYQPPTAPQYSPISIAPLSLPQMAAPTPITLPTADQVRQTPGYQFTQDQALKAAQQSAIGQGSYGGGTLQSLETNAGNIADTYYQNAVNNALNLGQTNFSNAFNVNQANAGNALNAYQASNNAALSAAGLNLQGTNQQFQNTYLPSWNAYLSDVGQNQFGANYGLNLAGLGLQAQNQYFNQGLQQNENAYNQYNTSQNAAFQQWLALAMLGNPGNPYA